MNMGSSWSHENHTLYVLGDSSKDGSHHAHIKMRTILRADFLPARLQEGEKNLCTFINMLYSYLDV